MMNGMVENKYIYRVLEGNPPANILQKMLRFYDSLFEDAQHEFFEKRLIEKEDVVSIVCLRNSDIVGFKIGYKYDGSTFYSWVGGVDKKYRKKGIAQVLLEKQHSVAVNKGYKKIRTKSMNQFKPMMILNLKNGFNIVKVYTNELQQTKIVFEKELN